MHFWPHFFIDPQVKSHAPPVQVAVPPAGAVQVAHIDPQWAGESSTQLPEQRCWGELQVGPLLPPAPPEPFAGGGAPAAPPVPVDSFPPVPGGTPLPPVPPGAPATPLPVPPLAVPPLPTAPEEPPEPFAGIAPPVPTALEEPPEPLAGMTPPLPTTPPAPVAWPPPPKDPPPPPPPPLLEPASGWNFAPSAQPRTARTPATPTIPKRVPNLMEPSLSKGSGTPQATKLTGERLSEDIPSEFPGP